MLASSAVTNLGTTVSHTAPVGITSLNTTGPSPVASTPVFFAEPSPVTWTTFAHITPLAETGAVASSISELLSALNNLPAGGTNLIIAPGTTNRKFEKVALPNFLIEEAIFASLSVKSASAMYPVVILVPVVT